MNGRLSQMLGAFALFAAVCAGATSAAHADPWIVRGSLQSYASDPQTPGAWKPRIAISAERTVAGEYGARVTAGTWRRTWGQDGNLQDKPPVLSASDYAVGAALVRRVSATPSFAMSLAAGVAWHRTSQESVSLAAVRTSSFSYLQPQVTLEALKRVRASVGVFAEVGLDLSSGLSHHDSSGEFAGAGLLLQIR